MGYKKKKNDDALDDPLKPTTFELKVAIHLHKNLENIDGKLSGCRVNIFYPQNAVDILLKSPWSEVNMKEKCTDFTHFTSEKIACDFMSQLLRKGLISRALKSKKDPNRRKDFEKKKRKPTKVVDSGSDDSKNERKKNNAEYQEKELKSEKKSAKDSSGSESKVKTNSSSSWGFFSPSPVKPIRIEFTEDQIFLLTDPDTVYVWVYEPPPGLKAWLLGTALIIGIMFCCFFPIWPWQLRQGAYYLTLIALALLCLIVFLAIVRLFLYIITLTFTVGRFHFWLFPNLFSDCGVIDSFKPLYCIERAKSLEKLSDKKGLKVSSKSVKKIKDPVHENTSSGDASVIKQPSTDGDAHISPMKSDLGKQD